MSQYIQQSFAGGQISPAVFARSDIGKYKSSVAGLENFYVHIQGSASNRPGFEFIQYAYSDSFRSRLIPFRFNKQQAYALEMASGNMHIVKDGGLVLDELFRCTDVTRALPTVIELCEGTFVDGNDVYFSGLNTTGMIELEKRVFRLAEGVTTTGTITAITKAPAAVVTVSADHGLITGQTVYISGIVGMTALNDELYHVTYVSDTTFSLQDVVIQEDIDSTLFEDWVSGGTAVRKTFVLRRRYGGNANSLSWTALDQNVLNAQRLHTVSIPWNSSQLRDLRFAQDADLMTVCHNDHHPREIKRFDHDDWEITTPTFTPAIGAPTEGDATLQEEFVKDVSATNSWEHYTIEGATQAFPVVVTIDNTSGALVQFLQDGDQVGISHVLGMTELNGDRFILKNKTDLNPGVTAWTFDLEDLSGNSVDGRGYGAYASGGRLGHTLHSYKVTAIDKDTGEESQPLSFSVAGNPLGSHGAVETTYPYHQQETKVYLSWGKPSGYDVEEYKIYKDSNGVFGFIGSAKTNSFTDNNIAPAVLIKPPPEPVRDAINKAITTTELKHISSLTQASPIRAESWDHGLSTGQIVLIENETGMTEILTAGMNDDGYYTVTVLNKDQFTLDDTDGTGYGSVGNGTGTFTIPGVTLTNPVQIHSENHGYQKGDRIEITGVVGTTEINTGFRKVGGIIAGNTFQITNFDNVFYDGELWTAYTSGGVASDYPATVAYFKQRRLFGNTFNRVQTIHASSTAKHNDFNQQSDASDSDAFSFTISSGRVNSIEHMVPYRKSLFLFTSETVFRSYGVDGGYSFATVQNDEEEAEGASSVPPLKVNQGIVYVQDGIAHAWDLSYSFESDSFQGTQLTILAPEMVETDKIVEWAFERGIDRRIWCVTEKGKLLCMTYDKTQKVWGWSIHVTNGKFESVVSVREGDIDRLYVIVRRTLNGLAHRIIERLNDRVFDVAMDAFFVDSGRTYKDPYDVQFVDDADVHVVVGVPTGHGILENDVVYIRDTLGSTEVNDKYFRASLQGQANSITLVPRHLESPRNIVGITQSNVDPIITTATDHGLVENDVFYLTGIVGMTELNGSFYRCGPNTTGTAIKLRWLATPAVRPFTTPDTSSYTVYNSGGTYESATVSESLSATSDWDGGGQVYRCADTFYIPHLTGETVSILADGSVVVDEIAGDDGKVVLDNKYAIVHIGLAYTAKLTTLPLDDERGSLTNRTVSISKLLAKVTKTSSFKAGNVNGTLIAVPARNNENWDANARLITGDMSMGLLPKTDKFGQLLIEQGDPLPITLNSVGYEFEVSSP